MNGFVLLLALTLAQSAVIDQEAEHVASAQVQLNQLFQAGAANQLTSAPQISFPSLRPVDARRVSDTTLWVTFAPGITAFYNPETARLSSFMWRDPLRPPGFDPAEAETPPRDAVINAGEKILSAWMQGENPYRLALRPTEKVDEYWLTYEFNGITFFHGLITLVTLDKYSGFPIQVTGMPIENLPPPHPDYLEPIITEEEALAAAISAHLTTYPLLTASIESQELGFTSIRRMGARYQAFKPNHHELDEAGYALLYRIVAIYGQTSEGNDVWQRIYVDARTGEAVGIYVVEPVSMGNPSISPDARVALPNTLAGERALRIGDQQFFTTLSPQEGMVDLDNAVPSLSAFIEVSDLKFVKVLVFPSQGVLKFQGLYYSIDDASSAQIKRMQLPEPMSRS